MKLTLYFIVINIIYLREYLYGQIRPKYQHFEILSHAEIFNIVISSVFVKHLQNICIKPTTRDIHLSIIKAFVTYNLFHFGAKDIVTFVTYKVLLGLGVAYWWLLIWLCIIYNHVYTSVCNTCHINTKISYLLKVYYIILHQEDHANIHDLYLLQTDTKLDWQYQYKLAKLVECTLF